MNDLRFMTRRAKSNLNYLQLLVMIEGWNSIRVTGVQMIYAPKRLQTLYCFPSHPPPTNIFVMEAGQKARHKQRDTQVAAIRHRINRCAAAAPSRSAQKAATS